MVAPLQAHDRDASFVRRMDSAFQWSADSRLQHCATRSTSLVMAPAFASTPGRRAGIIGSAQDAARPAATARQPRRLTAGAGCRGQLPNRGQAATAGFISGQREDQRARQVVRPVPISLDALMALAVLAASRIGGSLALCVHRVSALADRGWLSAPRFSTFSIYLHPQ